MTSEAKVEAIIECDPEFYIKLSTHLQHSVTGQPVFYSDSLVDLVNRHCPDIYEMARDEGFEFVPSADKGMLEQSPPHIRFDVIRHLKYPLTTAI